MRSHAYARPAPTSRARMTGRLGMARSQPVAQRWHNGARCSREPKFSTSFKLVVVPSLFNPFPPPGIADLA